MSDYIPDLGPSMDDEINFGKYKGTGTTWQQALDRDRSYIEWVVNECEVVSTEIVEMLEDALDDGGFAF